MKTQRQKCQNKAENEKDCPCDELECERHGVCCECLAFHRQTKTKPMCLD